MTDERFSTSAWRFATLVTALNNPYGLPTCGCVGTDVELVAFCLIHGGRFLCDPCTVQHAIALHTSWTQSCDFCTAPAVNTPVWPVEVQQHVTLRPAGDAAWFGVTGLNVAAWALSLNCGGEVCVEMSAQACRAAVLSAAIAATGALN